MSRRKFNQIKLISNLTPVSLLHNRTAIPLVVLHSQEKQSSFHVVYGIHHMASLSEIYSNDIDFKPIHHFFNCGGHELLVFVVPVDTPLQTIIDQLQSIVQHFDLLYLARQSFDDLLLIALNLPQVMIIVDHPIVLHKRSNENYASNMIPMQRWVLYRDKPTLAVYPFLALMQQSDRERSIVQSCSHLTLPEDYCPLQVYAGGNGFTLNEVGLATFMGHYTLKSHHYFPVERAVHALRSSLEDICCGFVFEILDEKLCIDLQLSITGFLDNQRRILDCSKQDPFTVLVYPDLNGHIVHVQVSVFFPYQSDCIQLQFNVEREDRDE